MRVKRSSLRWWLRRADETNPTTPSVRKKLSAAANSSRTKTDAAHHLRDPRVTAPVRVTAVLLLGRPTGGGGLTPIAGRPRLAPTPPRRRRTGGGSTARRRTRRLRPAVFSGSTELTALERCATFSVRTALSALYRRRR